MPKGRSKGFGHYMSKKFFHPGNPENLERVFIAREKVKQKAEQEEERMREYQQEQERWTNRTLMAKPDDKDKMALSFMYELPPGHPKNKAMEEAGASSEYDKHGNKKQDFKFEWQRQAPREATCKGDPNIVDQPFGIQVQFSKCIRCQVWGHSHTEKHCPKFGKARDADEEMSVVVDDKKLIEEMKMTDRLQFTSYGTWDNGKVKKHYSLVFSSDEEHGEEAAGAGADIMLNLLKEIRTKKSDTKGKSIKRTRKPSRKQADKPMSDSDHEKRTKKRVSKKRMVTKKDKIKRKREPKKKAAEISESSKSEYLEKIDNILFSGIKPPKVKAKFLDEVDRILSEDTAQGSHESGSSGEDSESEADDSSSTSSEGLTESEMRLLNLITHNKIDVKKNFQSKYKDTLCHFCRSEEDNQHLAVCPVYDTIMRGTEFKDIKSNNNRKVKRALRNIREALEKRSSALSVTSIGTISAENMRLLDLSAKREMDERSKKALQILETSS